MSPLRALRGALSAFLLLSPLATVSASERDDINEQLRQRPFRAPDNPGGPRVGQDDRGDDFDGYPADPGTPNDAYYDARAEHRVYSPNYTGSFLAPTVHAGAGIFNAPWMDAPAVGGLVGAAFQFSSIQQIIDVSLGYTFGQAPTTVRSEDGTYTRHSLALTGALHPFFLRILRSGRSGFSEANAAILLGPSVEWVDLDLPSLQHRYVTFGWHTGIVAGTYLDDPHDSSSWWIEGIYRYNNPFGDRDHPLETRGSIHEHWLLIRLSWRSNGNVFHGLPRPSFP